MKNCRGSPEGAVHRESRGGRRHDRTGKGDMVNALAVDFLKKSLNVKRVLGKPYLGCPFDQKM